MLQIKLLVISIFNCSLTDARIRLHNIFDFSSGVTFGHYDHRFINTCCDQSQLAFLFDFSYDYYDDRIHDDGFMCVMSEVALHLSDREKQGNQAISLVARGIISS